MTRKRVLAVLAVAAMILGWKLWHDTMRDPVVRTMEIALPGGEPGAKPTTIALLTDLHVAGPDMPPSRVERIVEQVNALEPDLVLIAGDLVSDKRTATKHYATEEAFAPLAGLRPRLGTIAVLGNHDHWRSASDVREALANAGITVLSNSAVTAGPLVIGGLDDDFTGHANMMRMLAEMDRLNGARIVLSHSPDPFPDLPADTGLMLAGHTHCGQIAYPWGGSPATMSRYGQKYACGIVNENGNVLIASGGLGTSLLPLRFLTQPEIWLIELKTPGAVR